MLYVHPTVVRRMRILEAFLYFSCLICLFPHHVVQNSRKRKRRKRCCVPDAKNQGVKLRHNMMKLARRWKKCMTTLTNPISADLERTAWQSFNMSAPNYHSRGIGD
ncbi:hypothetical protein IWZ01DRAFT_500214 [Phyllosticta capitalensis]